LQFKSFSAVTVASCSFSFSFCRRQRTAGVQFLTADRSIVPWLGLIACGLRFAPEGLKPKPSPARQRTLDLQAYALAFSVAVNAACPARFPDPPSETVWGQLVRAADSASNNLLEADDASGDADFVYKMRVALREAKESRQCLAKVRLGRLAAFDKVGQLEQEAGELSAIFATIVINTEKRLERERRQGRHPRYARKL
jgi:four helix bundle protein